MRRIFFLLIFLCTAHVAWSQPLPSKLNQKVIIDTDCGIDDMRAITLLLSRPGITIDAVLLSAGSLSPATGSEKVGSLLNEFGRGDIPVATGPDLKGVNPPWRKFNEGIVWSSQPGSTVINSNAVKILAERLKKSETRVTIICLGPLTNAGQLIRTAPECVPKIERIVWYNDSSLPMKGFNYESDRENAGLVLRSDVRIDIISNLNKSGSRFDMDLYDACRRSTTRLSSVLSSVHSQDEVFRRLKEGHFRLCDELVALYITNPELFDINLNTSELNIRYATDYNVNGIKEAMTEMITGTYTEGRNVVFSRFPASREMFSYDIRPIIDTAIALYGPEEWKASVMTDEFHGHLGVFSIVGAKMGIRARELFGVGPDELKVVTFAGSKPPYSCLTDGIQVATGATLGMGTIKLAGDPVSSPSAIFTLKDRSVRITLKKEYLAMVDADIAEGILKFGLMDDGYWKLVRRNAIKYWIEWDRKKIFEVEELNPEAVPDKISAM